MEVLDADCVARPRGPVRTGLQAWERRGKLKIVWSACSTVSYAWLLCLPWIEKPPGCLFVEFAAVSLVRLLLSHGSARESGVASVFRRTLAVFAWVVLLDRPCACCMGDAQHRESVCVARSCYRRPVAERCVLSDGVV